MPLPPLHVVILGNGTKPEVTAAGAVVVVVAGAPASLSEHASMVTSRSAARTRTTGWYAWRVTFWPRPGGSAALCVPIN